MGSKFSKNFNHRPFAEKKRLLAHCFDFTKTMISHLWVGGRNLERRNVELPIFRTFKITNIKMTKDELFDNFIFECNFSFFRNHLDTQNI